MLMNIWSAQGGKWGWDWAGTGEMVEVECIRVNWLITCNVVTSLECRIAANQFSGYRHVLSCLLLIYLWGTEWKIYCKWTRHYMTEILTFTTQQNTNVRCTSFYSSRFSFYALLLIHEDVSDIHVRLLNLKKEDTLRIKKREIKKRRKYTRENVM